MTTLMRVQEAARIAAQCVGGPARAAFKAFESALEEQIAEEQAAVDRAVAAMRSVDEEIKQ